MLVSVCLHGRTAATSGWLVGGRDDRAALVDFLDGKPAGPLLCWTFEYHGVLRALENRRADRLNFVAKFR